MEQYWDKYPHIGAKLVGLDEETGKYQTNIHLELLLGGAVVVFQGLKFCKLLLIVE